MVGFENGVGAFIVFLFGVLLVKGIWGIWGYLSNFLSGEQALFVALALFIVCALVLFVLPLRVLRGED